MLRVIISFISLILSSFILFQPSQITVYLIGDSTMSIKDTKAYPETGWGMPFVHFFDSTVIVKNLAMNGRSTRTFISEKRWSPVANNLKEGDYVFIQFGHNDESEAKVERYTTPEQFKTNLLKFVNETKSKKANPVLITPVSRRSFDSTGKALETHKEYSEIVRSLAREQKVPLIDLDKKSQELYQKLGAENSKLLFLWLDAQEHPNYPDGKEDNTHFNELGARKIAELVLSEIKTLNLDLVQRIVKK